MNLQESMTYGQTDGWAIYTADFSEVEVHNKTVLTVLLYDDELMFYIAFNII